MSKRALRFIVGRSIARSSGSTNTAISDRGQRRVLAIGLELDAIPLHRRQRGTAPSDIAMRGWKAKERTDRQTARNGDCMISLAATNIGDQPGGGLSGGCAASPVTG